MASINLLHVAQGTVNAVLNREEAIMNVRIQICQHCDFYNSVNNSCGSCGCPLNKKARVKKSKCPLKKW